MSTALNRTFKVMPHWHPSDPSPYYSVQIASAPAPIPIFAAEAIYLHTMFSASGAYQDLAFRDYEQAARVGSACIQVTVRTRCQAKR